MENIRYKKLSELAHEPTRGSIEAAGWDLYAALESPVAIAPGNTVKIPTDISIELPPGTFGGIYARSGLATKNGLAPANKVGICDADYRGNYIVALHNHSDREQVVQPGDRIAQLIVQPFIPINLIETKEELSTTARGDGGFNSTGR